VLIKGENVMPQSKRYYCFEACVKYNGPSSDKSFKLQSLEKNLKNTYIMIYPLSL